MAYYDPTFDVDFAAGDSPVTKYGFSFTRATAATYVNAAGNIATAASGELRYTYDPVTLSALGVLIEEQRTNLLLNTDTLSTQSVTVTAVAYTLSFYGTGTVTLSGVSTAGPLVGTGAFPTRVTLTFTPTAGSLTLTVTGSVRYANLEVGSFATSWIPTTGTAATRNADVLSLTGAAGRTNLVTGSAAPSTQTITVANATQYTLSQTGSGTITLTGASTSGPLVGAGTLTFTTGSTSLTLTMSGSPANVQLETGSSATAYIATTNGPRTVENVASWFNGDAGTWVAHVARSTAPSGQTGGTAPRAMTIYDVVGTNSAYISLAASGSGRSLGTTPAGTQWDITPVAAYAEDGSAYRIAMAYAENDVQVCAKGVLGTADTSAVMPAGLQYIVLSGISSRYLNGTISRIRYYNNRIPDADLILLSNGVDLSTPRTGGGIPKRKRKPRRIVVDDVIYDVPERDLPAFIDSVIQARSVPASVEVTVDQRPDTGVQQAVAPEVRLPPRGETPESLQARADALRVHLMRQQADRALLVLIDRTIARLMAEIEDEEEAAIALLLH